ncbi:MAG: preprotein translocase subunit YajC [Parvularculaceae bacterium]
MLISPAYAQAAGAPAPSLLNSPLPMFVLIGVMFYFMIWRPQQTARKKHMEMIANLRKGDVVVTSGGFIGKVSKVLDGEEIMVELADNVVVKVIKSTLTDVRTKPSAPANDQ